MANTWVKKKILSMIQNAEHPVSYARIKEKMNASCSRVTIYRTLLRLENENLISRFADQNGDFQYASCKKEDQPEKAYFQCTECNSFMNLEIEQPPSFAPTDLWIHSINFLATGICPECHNKSRGN